MHRLIAPLLLALPLLLAAPASAGEGVFTVSTLSQAREAAGTSRLALVFLTGDDDDSAFMEREAWGHPDVRAWVGEHAVATRVSARSFHGAKLQSTYRLEDLPAVLAFEGDTLVRQHQGGLGGTELLAWLQLTRTGDTALADMVHEAAAAEPGEPGRAIDLDARLLAAMQADTPAAAAAALVDLWEETVDTPQQDARRARVCEALESRVAADVVARERVVGAREAAWSRHRKRRTLPDLLDWFALNHLLDDDEATRAWVREARADKKEREVLVEVLAHPDDPVLPMLVETGSWSTLGAAVLDPIALLDARRATYKATRITITGAESSADQAVHRREMGAIVAGLLAADREREGREAADHILTLDRKAGPTIIEVALDAHEPRRWMRGFVDPSKPEQVQLAMQLTQALQGI